MGKAEVAQFLAHVAGERHVARPRNQALAALVFLYREVVRRLLAGRGVESPADALVELPGGRRVSGLGGAE